MRVLLRLALVVLLIWFSFAGISSSSTKNFPQPSENEILIAYIQQRAAIYKLPVRMIYRMIEVESRWNMADSGQLVGEGMVMGRTGDCGLMQVRVPTAQFIMNDPSITAEQLATDHILNVECGMKYIAYLRDRYKNMKLALTAYNRGPAKVNKSLAMGISPYNGYGNKVLGKR